MPAPNSEPAWDATFQDPDSGPIVIGRPANLEMIGAGLDVGASGAGGSPRDATTLLFGVDTFGDVIRTGTGAPDAASAGDPRLVEVTVLADGAGLLLVGFGEHHRADFAVSSPEMVLTAAANWTARPFVSAVP